MIGAPLDRVENAQLVQGRGLFASDITLPNLAHAVVLRSPHAHARICEIEADAARALPGVLAVVTFAEIAAFAKALPQPLPHPQLQSHMPYPLAREVVRYVGEAVALIVAENRPLAEEARSLLRVRYEALPAAIDVVEAATPQSPLVGEGMASNVAAHLRQEVGDVAAAMANAALVLEDELVLGRASAQPLELRAVTALYHPDDPAGLLTIWWSTQGPHSMRNTLAEQLGIDPSKIRVIAPLVGGGFGVKNRYYPEDTVIAWLAMTLGRPVQYLEDRLESFTATYQGRAQVHRVTLAVDADGLILALADHFWHDQGAYTPLGLVVPFITAVSLPGPYRIPAYQFDCRVVLTHKTPTAPYRGAGKPEANFVLERMLDLAAQRLQIDPVEIRRRNLLQPSDFPHDTGLIDLDGSHVLLDSGDPQACLQKTLELLGCAAMDADSAPLAHTTPHTTTGVGVACYIEMTGRGPFEGARVRVTADGRIQLLCALSSQGQSHATTLGQICAATLGVDFAAVEVLTGDSAFMDKSIGTYASRVAVMGGNAVAQAATAFRQEALQAAAADRQVASDDLLWQGGRILQRDSPHCALTLAELACHLASNGGNSSGGNSSGGNGSGGNSSGAHTLDATRYYFSNRPAYAFGAYAVAVAVDVETGVVRIVRHALTHDCGVAINPRVVVAQIRGGVAQGIGGALCEEVIYDGRGNLLTASLRDFHLPCAADVPSLHVALANVPSPFNPLGVKGVGEAGVIPVAAAVCAAVEQALAKALGHPVRIRRAPLSAPLVSALALTE